MNPKNQFNAILHNADLPLAGVKVTAYFNNNQLCITQPDLFVPVELITVSVGGFDHKDLVFNWTNTDDQTYSLTINDKTLIQAIIKTAPFALHYQLNKWQNRDIASKVIWTSLIGISASFILSLVLLWAYYDNALLWLTGYITTAQEKQLGQTVLAQLDETELIKQGTAVDAIKTIGEKITQNSAYQYQWFIKKDKTINAFALPGGIIVVHSGLLAKMDNADELAGVLAHESQHVEQRHALKNIVQSVGWASALMLVLGDVNTATAVIVHQLGNLYFSRDKEEEADRLGLQTLIRAKLNPQGMVLALEKLAKEEKNHAPAWLSSHPATTERIALLQQEVKANPCADCQSLKIDWQAVQHDVALIKN